MASHHLSMADEFSVGNGKNPVTGRRGVPFTPICQVDLGQPATADADGICASQSVSSGVAALLDGAVGATLDVPRNVVAAWTNTAVITVRGLDVYGRPMTESSGSGTSFTGKKAFKTITSVTFSASVTGATVGTGTVLGLPYRIGGSFDVLSMWADNTAQTPTIAAGDATTPSATTGDVRGTVAPNSAPNGSLRYRVWMKVHNLRSDEGCFGLPQFAG